MEDKNLPSDFLYEYPIFLTTHFTFKKFNDEKYFLTS